MARSFSTYLLPQTSQCAGLVVVAIPPLANTRRNWSNLLLVLQGSRSGRRPLPPIHIGKTDQGRKSKGLEQFEWCDPRTVGDTGSLSVYVLGDRPN